MPPFDDPRPSTLPDRQCLRRLGSLSQHVRMRTTAGSTASYSVTAGTTAGTAGTTTGGGAQQEGRATPAAPIRFEDASMQQFITAGYVMLQPSLPASFNARICEKVDRLHEAKRDTGNNLLAQLPDLMSVFDSPVVHGALQSILGHDYYIHLHHATHTKRGIEEVAL